MMCVLALASLVQISAANAQTPVKNTQEVRYTACLAQARTRSADAFDEAARWHDDGGGLPSRHCAAIALINLGQPSEAAARLSELARAPGSASAQLRADLFAQAGNAWLLGGISSEAVNRFTDALKLTPDEPQILTDRARAYVMLGQLADAGQDLNRSITVAPNYIEAYVVRAGLRRKAGDMALAREDITKALKLDPNHSQALLERGIERQIDGDRQGARADWLKVIANAAQSKKDPEDEIEESETLSEARRYLEALDVKGAAGAPKP